MPNLLWNGKHDWTFEGVTESAAIPFIFHQSHNNYEKGLTMKSKSVFLGVTAVIGACLISFAFAMDPYDELGVSSRASPEQIKKVNLVGDNVMSHIGRN